MRRRKLLSCGGIVGIGTVAGCLGTIQSFNNTKREADRTQFKEIESVYVVSVRNNLDKSADVKVSVTGAEGTTVEENIIVEPGDKMVIRSLFPMGSYNRDSEPYTISVSADGKETEQTQRPSKSRTDKFAFEIDSDGISFQEALRPSPDLGISNQLDEDVDVRVTVRDHSGDGAVYDILTISANDYVGYRDVLTKGREYNVTIQANGMTESITHLNSDTTTISITIEPHTISAVGSEA
ncbi:hypothetical protein [Haloterrigena alkaliphila]|uniref:Lipoprotein n=1 Tax=Haloterrigena alkaliphila TaxID=2816475 RepID=A0A8A2VE77_9EURY|nr:hypothetical protein [Haloterrigena alkaliphila]QSW98977.1 hypothetical protein J0X25_16580 [Haloterrigena alkaliphila]